MMTLTENTPLSTVLETNWMESFDAEVRRLSNGRGYTPDELWENARMFRQVGMPALDSAMSFCRNKGITLR